MCVRLSSASAVTFPRVQKQKDISEKYLTINPVT